MPTRVLSGWETVVIGAGTYLIRALSLSGGSRIRWPDAAKTWLSFVAPAVLGALLGPLVFLPGNHWVPLLHNPTWMAAVPTVIVGGVSRNLFLTVAVGVGCFALIRQFV